MVSSNLRVNDICNEDAICYLHSLDDNSVDLTITDIPYGEVNRESNGLRVLDKQAADIVTFDLNELVDELCRVTKGSKLPKKAVQRS